MTVKQLISTISAIDTIKIQDTNGEDIFHGNCQDFRATCEKVHNYLDKEVDCIRAYKSCIIILL